VLPGTLRVVLGIPGAAGTMLSCFLQVFYVMFLFPWCFHLAERSTRSQHQPD
jgi:hypothetical protein